MKLSLPAQIPPLWQLNLSYGSVNSTLLVLLPRPLPLCFSEKLALLILWLVNWYSTRQAMAKPTDNTITTHLGQADRQYLTTY